MTQLKDTLEGQIRSVFPDAVTTLTDDGGFDPMDHPIKTLRIYGLGDTWLRKLLVVREDNIVKRRNPKDPDNATWYIRHGSAARLLKEVDCVLVQYGPAAEGGEIWEASRGNNRKGSYRRLAYIKDIGVEREFGYNEIETTFTENNLLLFKEGKPLEDTSDFSNR